MEAKSRLRWTGVSGSDNTGQLQHGVATLRSVDSLLV